MGVYLDKSKNTRVRERFISAPIGFGFTNLDISNDFQIERVQVTKNTPTPYWYETILGYPFVFVTFGGISEHAVYLSGTSILTEKRAAIWGYSRQVDWKLRNSVYKKINYFIKKRSKFHNNGIYALQDPNDIIDSGLQIGQYGQPKLRYDNKLNHYFI